MTKKYKFDTLALHAGHTPDTDTGSRAVPIYQTTSYVFKDAAQAANLFALKEFGNIYTRLMNPTTDVLEQRVAALEGGVGALAVSSGMAAISLAIMNIAQKNDEIVASTDLYGGTVTLFQHTLRKLGIRVRMVDPSTPSNFEEYINDRTKAIYIETLGNPKLQVLDIEEIAKIAHKHGLPLLVDNTSATPYLCRPIEFEADIVIHSLTKYLGGHGTSIGGIIVDSGKFDWAQNAKFPELTEPDPSYHGIKYVETFGHLAYIIKARVQLLRDLGAAISPFNSFLILQGIETLSLRMQRHSSNALAVAKFLKNHPMVNWVNYPGLEDNPAYHLTQKYMSRGASGLIGFGIKGGYEAGIKFIESVKLLSHLANIGDAKSLVIHPASTTHQQLTKEERAMAGVTDDFIRLSIGLEDIDDILKDIDNALNSAKI